MSMSITLLAPKEIDLVYLEAFSIASGYYTRSGRKNGFFVEKEYAQTISLNYLIVETSEDYMDLAIEDYLEFDHVTEQKAALIKNCSFITVSYRDPDFLYPYLEDLFAYFVFFEPRLLIDDDYGNLFTVAEFREKYLDT